MKINGKVGVKEFKDAIAQARGDVWLESVNGDKYNLKSYLCQYIAIGEILSNHANDLELFCSLPQDEPLFLKLFEEGLLST